MLMLAYINYLETSSGLFEQKVITELFNKIDLAPRLQGLRKLMNYTTRMNVSDL